VFALVTVYTALISAIIIIIIIIANRPRNVARASSARWGETMRDMVKNRQNYYGNCTYPRVTAPVRGEHPVRHDTPWLPKMISIASEWRRRQLRTSGRAVVAFNRRPSGGRRDDGCALANGRNHPVTAKQEIIVQTNTFLSFPEGQFAWSRANKIIAATDASKAPPGKISLISDVSIIIIMYRVCSSPFFLLQ